MTGGEVAGAAVGGALGLIGGPVGIAAGAAGGVIATRIFRRIGSEVHSRWLSPREHSRVGGAFALAAAAIKFRLDAGESLRDDWFVAAEGTDRSEAEEGLEGVLKAAADAYEERKVPYLANLYASAAFRRDISAPYFNALLQLANRCTWRQLVLMALLGEDDTEFASKIDRLLDPVPEAPREPAIAVWLDLDALAFAGLVGVRQEDGSSAHLAAVLEGGSFRNLGWSRACLTSAGVDLSELMCLDAMPREDVDGVISALKRGT